MRWFSPLGAGVKHRLIVAAAMIAVLWLAVLWAVA